MLTQPIEIAETLRALLDEVETLEREASMLHEAAARHRVELRLAAVAYVGGARPDLASLMRSSGAVTERLRQVRATEEAILAALAELPITLAAEPASELATRAMEALARKLGVRR